jgi:hypothetical protein
MSTTNQRKILQQDIDNGLFPGKNPVINADLPPAPIIASHKQGLISKDYVIVEQKNCSSRHFQGQLNDVIFDQCDLNSSKFSGNFNNTYFMYCDLINANFTETQNLTPEQVYTSYNLDQAVFADDKNFKKAVSALIEDENKTMQEKKKTSSFLAQITGDISEIILEFSQKVLGREKQDISLPLHSPSSPRMQAPSKKPTRSI